jgi:hypothetical protein
MLSLIEKCYFVHKSAFAPGFLANVASDASAVDDATLRRFEALLKTAHSFF